MTISPYAESYGGAKMAQEACEGDLHVFLSPEARCKCGQMWRIPEDFDSKETLSFMFITRYIEKLEDLALKICGQHSGKDKRCGVCRRLREIKQGYGSLLPKELKEKLKEAE